MHHKFLLCLFAVIVIMMTPAAINAQENMYVWKADGSVDTFIVSELDSISFYLPECSSGIGAFSVSATRKVAFSSGNLQYNAASGSHLCADGTIKQGSLRFAEHQWDIIGMGFGQTDKSKDCYIGGTTVGGVGMLGRYWPSTAAGVKDAYNLLFGSHYIYTGAGYNRNDARSVRLVREL